MLIVFVQSGLVHSFLFGDIAVVSSIVCTSSLPGVQVEYVEQQVLHERQKKGYTVPTDPLWGNQWSLVRQCEIFDFTYISQELLDSCVPP